LVAACGNNQRNFFIFPFPFHTSYHFSKARRDEKDRKSANMTTPRFIIPTAMYAVTLYMLFLPISLLVAAGVWADKVSGVLYLCIDSMGIFDFIPPFVHAAGGDVYYVPAWRVYLVWYLLLAGALLLPAPAIGALWWRWRKVDKDND
jgi:hypothetical protein